MMRNTFIQELVKLAHINTKLVLIVGDLGYSVVEPFANTFPDRFINAGIAEQNMIGLAAGMASEGYHVFTYSIANFPTFRCAEQIRNDVAYHNLPVTIVSVGGGLSYGSLGYSHHAVQDYALIRTLPNMLIAAPGDPMEVQACIRYLVSNPGPSYLRLGKAGEPNFHNKPPKISPGSWIKLRNNGDSKHALLSTGAGLQLAMEWASQDKYTAYDIYSLPLWSMADKLAQASLLRMYDEIVTVEDHLLDGGFSSWLLEAQALAKIPSVITPIALSPEVCNTVGTQATLNRLGGVLP